MANFTHMKFRVSQLQMSQSKIERSNFEKLQKKSRTSGTSFKYSHFEKKMDQKDLGFPN